MPWDASFGVAKRSRSLVAVDTLDEELMRKLMEGRRERKKMFLSKQSSFPRPC